MRIGAVRALTAACQCRCFVCIQCYQFFSYLRKKKTISRLIYNAFCLKTLKDFVEPALQLLFNIHELSFKAQLLNEFYGAELYIIKQKGKQPVERGNTVPFDVYDSLHYHQQTFLGSQTTPHSKTITKCGSSNRIPHKQPPV